MAEPEPVEVIRADTLAELPHGFLGRRGGVSDGIYSGLDMGRAAQGANPALAENRRRAIAAVAPGMTLVTLYQVHSADVITVTDPIADEDRPKADAMVTDRPGLLLGILTADCAPILFADRDAGVIGAAHAGWKGAIGGVTDATVAAMEALGASRNRIVAAIGPCIGQASYEVDEGFRDRFLADDPANAAFFMAGRPGHHHFALESYVAARLTRAGIARVEPLGLDTLADPDRFFSYRRATLAGEPDYGREISLIGLPSD